MPVVYDMNGNIEVIAKKNNNEWFMQQTALSKNISLCFGILLSSDNPIRAPLHEINVVEVFLVFKRLSFVNWKFLESKNIYFSLTSLEFLAIYDSLVVAIRPWTYPKSIFNVNFSFKKNKRILATSSLNLKQKRKCHTKYKTNFNVESNAHI